MAEGETTGGYVGVGSGVGVGVGDGVGVGVGVCVGIGDGFICTLAVLCGPQEASKILLTSMTIKKINLYDIHFCTFMFFHTSLRLTSVS